MKYLLLLTLLIILRPERTVKRRVAKYIVLLVSLYFWACADIMSLVFKDADYKGELAEKSFKENAVPIYGKVVFASYMRRESIHKRSIEVAEKVSPQTSGYIVIVQFNDTIYPYEGLKSLYQNFIEYSHDRTDLTYIPEKIPDLLNCRRFISYFSDSLKKIPELPAVNKYVKILFDPNKHRIEMYTDSATAVTPSFDSLPGVKLLERSN